MPLWKRGSTTARLMAPRGAAWIETAGRRRTCAADPSLRVLTCHLKPLQQLMYLWADGRSVADATRHTDSTKKSVLQWFQYLRDMCSRDLLQNPRILGGAGQTVAIDESLVARRKPGNAQGRPIAGQWVFGGVDLQTKDFFMQLVPRRDAATRPSSRPTLRQGHASGATSGLLMAS